MIDSIRTGSTFLFIAFAAIVVISTIYLVYGVITAHIAKEHNNRKDNMIDAMIIVIILTAASFVLSTIDTHAVNEPNIKTKPQLSTEPTKEVKFQSVIIDASDQDKALRDCQDRLDKEHQRIVDRNK